jgi:Ran GTPase-activating protein 1
LDLSWNSIGGHEEPDGYDSDGDEQTKFVADLTGVQAIADALKVTPSITSLSLGQNELGDEGAIAIAQALKESKVSKLASLDLTGKGYGEGRIGPTGAKELAEYLLVTASIASVWSPAHQPAPVCALNVPSSLLISYSCLSLDPSCAQLNLSANILGSEGAAALAPAIAVCASVTKILVAGNKLGNAGVTVLCDALRESKVTKVQELGLRSNEIGPEGAKAVAAMAAVVASITLVDLEFNDLGEEGKVVLRKAVEGRSGCELLL